MGILISRFRAKPTTRELLEDLEKEIEALEEYKRSTELQQKAVVRSLVFYSMILYIIVAGVFLFYSFPTETKDRIIYCIPLLIFPVLLYILKKFLHWYFLQKIRSNDENLLELKRRKKSLLDFAMETETYKNVKELLERFDPEYHKRIFEPKRAIEASPSTQSLKGSFAEMELRRRNVPSKPSSPIALGAPGATISPIQLNASSGSPNIFPMFHGKHPTNPPYPPAFYPRGGQPFARPPIQPMPRPVLPRERTLVDRLVDYLVGDGPSNRYALICRQCQSHNGMALKEEFEFVAFRCCYCFTWNPPRNQQPPPPRLTLPAPLESPPAITDAAVSDASSSSGLEDDGNETKESVNAEVADGETENVSDNESISNVKGSSMDSTSEQSMPKRLSSSSENEIQAELEEDKPYVAPHPSEEYTNNARIYPLQELEEDKPYVAPHPSEEFTNNARVYPLQEFTKNEDSL